VPELSAAPGASPAGGERRPSISVIVPVYRCAECLEELSSRLERTLSALTDRYEILLVDDRSPDDAWRRIGDLASRHPAVSAIRLSRNFGQHIAITAGLAASKGELAVVMDCDLQDAPELIASLHAKLSEGYDMVLARRIGRSHSLFRVWGARAYFWLLNRMSGEKLDGAYGCYSIVRRKVVEAYLTFQERERHSSCCAGSASKSEPSTTSISPGSTARVPIIFAASCGMPWMESSSRRRSSWNGSWGWVSCLLPQG
jgi:glycosyltransferase involved in cell wall biosynthesis